MFINTYRTRSRHLRMGTNIVYAHRAYVRASPSYATNYGFFISFRAFYVTLDLFRFNRQTLRNIRKLYVGEP